MENKSEYKRCPICQRFFTPLTDKQKYCNYKCREKKTYYTPQPIRYEYCLECGKKFETRLGFQKFCSDRCRKTHYSIKIEKENVCRHCGKKFISTSSVRQYCSKEHYLLSKKIREHNRWKLKKETENG